MPHPLTEVEHEELSGENSPFPAWDINPVSWDLIEDSKTIWRYTTIPQFLNSLRKRESEDHSALNFTRTSWFDDEDNFEGTVPAKNIINHRENLEQHLDSGVDVDEHLLKKYGGQLPDVEDSTREGAMERMRQLVYLNCWISKERESNPMWYAYTNRTTGIAIKSTVGDLINSLVDWSGRVFYGQIRYLDFEEDRVPLSPIQNFFIKRQEFIEEQEFRLALSFKNTPAMLSPTNTEDMASPPNKDRLDITIDLDSLASGIFLHPQSPDYVKPMVEDILSKYNIDSDLVSHSSLRPD
jgi:hypothetical protein